MAEKLEKWSGFCLTPCAVGGLQGSSEACGLHDSRLNKVPTYVCAAQHVLTHTTKGRNNNAAV